MEKWSHLKRACLVYIVYIAYRKAVVNSSLELRSSPIEPWYVEVAVIMTLMMVEMIMTKTTVLMVMAMEIMSEMRMATMLKMS